MQHSSSSLLPVRPPPSQSQAQAADQQSQRAAEGRQAPGLLPFVVTELVAMVIRRNDVDKQDVLGLGVHACDFHLVAGEHPPEGVRG